MPLMLPVVQSKRLFAACHIRQDCFGTVFPLVLLRAGARWIIPNLTTFAVKLIILTMLSIPSSVTRNAILELCVFAVLKMTEDNPVSSYLANQLPGEYDEESLEEGKTSLLKPGEAMLPS
ncbi:hypothetical protein CHU98_g10099 [Xylaria longipes]|nr:hypothetical protein CHU98_g10099 [Xylaria longipes]